MSSTVTFNGTSYTIPATGDENWSDNLSLYLIAIASGSLQKTGGTFTLTAEADFGATYGLKSNYFKSRATNPSSTGILRLGNNEGIGFRNAANNADLVLKANASDVLEYNGSSIVSTGSLTDLITNTMVNSSAAIAYSKLNLATSIVNGDISSSAAIALSKLAALTTGKVLQSNASTGAIEASSITGTTLGYLDATSSVQTQLDARIAKSLVTTKGDIICATANATPARVAVGSDGLFLKADSAQSTGVVWASAASAALSVTTKTTTYTATTADDIILVTTGSAWTLTLYAASGNSGKILTIKKTSSDVNALTIDGNGSETIDGTTTTTIDTQYETIKILCDGSNWHILERKYNSTPIAYTPTFTGFGTPSSVNFVSWRVGKHLRVQGTFVNGTPTATEARITIGYGGTSANVTSASTLPTLSLVGEVADTGSASTTDFRHRRVLIEASKTYMTFGLENSSTSGSLVKQNANQFSGAGSTISVFGEFEIEGWKGN